MSGQRVFTSRDGSRFVPLDRALWRPGPFPACHCSYCKGKTPGYWDTLVVPASGHTFLTHVPELHHGHVPEFLRGEVRS